MNHKRKKSSRTIWRKELAGKTNLLEWSRMLHKGWKRDLETKINLKSKKTDILDL